MQASVVESIHENARWKLVAYARRRLKSDDEAEDVASEAIARALATNRDITGSDAVKYAMRIAVNIIMDLGRKNSRFTLVSLEEGQVADKACVFDAQPCEDGFAQLIRNLTPAERACVTMHYQDDLSVAEIAVRTGRCAGTVRSFLHRGVARARRSYRELHG